MAPKAPLGSLKSMAANIKNKTAALNSSPLSHQRDAAKDFKNSKAVEDTSSDSSSEDSDSDSDDDSDEKLEAARKKLEAKQAAKKSSNAAPAAKVNGAKDQKSGSASVVNPKPSSAPKKKPVSESESESTSEEDSDTSSSDDNDDKPPKPTTVKAKANAEDEDDSDSDDDDEDSDSEDESSGAKLPAKNSETAKGKSKEEEEDTSSDDDDDDDEEDEDDDDDEEEDEDEDEEENETVADPLAIAKVNGQVTVADSKSAEQATNESFKSPSWLNNSDFTIRKALSNNPGKEVADFFKQASLEGKQVWYFTAPASLPITVLQNSEIDLSKVMAGDASALISHNGEDYGINLEPYTTNSQIQVLIPSSGGDKYTTFDRRIDSVVHVQRTVKFSGEGENGAAVTDDYVRKPKPAREQPQGLRARFAPIGAPVTPGPAVLKSPESAKSIASPKSILKRPVHTIAQDESDSESDSEEDSDVEMTNAPANGGNLKRKQEEEAPPSAQPAKLPKRAKVTSAQPTSTPLSSQKSTSSSKRETPVPPPTILTQASVSDATPVKPQDEKKQKKTKKDKATKADTKGTTRILPPSFPSSSASS